MALTVLAGVDALRDTAGLDLGHTDWFEVTQDRIDRFADATGDAQWIHVDTERAARESPFGTTIAHGYLTLSLCSFVLPQLLRVTETTMGINYGVNRVRFPSPVRSGARVRGHGLVLAAEDVDQGVQLTIQITIEAERESKPACVAETLNRWIA